MSVTDLYLESIDGIEPLDVLAIVAHPSEAEWLCGGTLRKLVLAGKRVGVVDLTAGEVGSRGSVEDRMVEAAEASAILGLAFRGCRRFPDGRLENTLAARMTLLADLRRLCPTLVILPRSESVHPDVRVATQMAADACYLSGIAKLDDDTPPHRPKRILYAAPAIAIPSLVVDITSEFDTKVEALMAHRTQVAGREEYAKERLCAEASTQGARAGVRYGEGFISKEAVLVSNVKSLLV